MLDLKKVSLCLLTKESTYPQEILDNVNNYPFGEVLIGTNSNTPYLKHELFRRAKFGILAYQDDDAIVPWDKLIKQYKQNMINVGIKEGHFEAYKNRRMTMGLGWGSIFPKSILKELKRYTDKFGFDDLFQRDTEKILTQLVYPQNRVILPIVDLPSAYDMDRLWRQTEHYSNMQIIEDRCKTL